MNDDMIMEVLALAEIDIETLDTRNSDELDFTELAAWEIKKLIETAYISGYYDALKKAVSEEN